MGQPPLGAEARCPSSRADSRPRCRPCSARRASSPTARRCPAPTSPCPTASPGRRRRARSTSSPTSPSAAARIAGVRRPIFRPGAGLRARGRGRGGGELEVRRGVGVGGRLREARRLEDGAREQALGPFRGHVVADARAARALAEDGHACRVAAEGADGPLDPLEGKRLVEEARVRVERLVRRVAEKPDARVRGHEKEPRKKKRKQVAPRAAAVAQSAPTAVRPRRGQPAGAARPPRQPALPPFVPSQNIAQFPMSSC